MDETMEEYFEVPLLKKRVDECLLQFSIKLSASS